MSKEERIAALELQVAALEDVPRASLEVSTRTEPGHVVGPALSRPHPAVPTRREPSAIEEDRVVAASPRSVGTERTRLVAEPMGDRASLTRMPRLLVLQSTRTMLLMQIPPALML